MELFFKWIKQHLRIKRFFGTSENAVKTQIWCAVATYVLIAIVKKELQLDASLYTLSTDLVGLGLRENPAFMRLATENIVDKFRCVVIFSVAIQGATRLAPFFCAPGRAHLLGGESPLLTRQGEVLAERQGCRGRLRI